MFVLFSKFVLIIKIVNLIGHNMFLRLYPSESVLSNIFPPNQRALSER